MPQHSSACWELSSYLLVADGEWLKEPSDVLTVKDSSGSISDHRATAANRTVEDHKPAVSNRPSAAAKNSSKPWPEPGSVRLRRFHLTVSESILSWRTLLLRTDGSIQASVRRSPSLMEPYCDHDHKGELSCSNARLLGTSKSTLSVAGRLKGLAKRRRLGERSLAWGARRAVALLQGD